MTLQEMIEGKSTLYFFEIKEYTRNEWVTTTDAHPLDDIVRRWSRTGDEQRYLFLPIGDDKYKVIDKKGSRYWTLYKVAARYPTFVGDLWGLAALPREVDTDKQHQIFRIEMGRTTNGVNFREFTKDEHLKVGDHGFLVRWTPDNYEFTLIPHRISGERPQVRESQIEPGKIGPAPRISDYDTPPNLQTNPVLIGETIITAVYVRDNKYGRFIATQADENPYYKLTREQYYDRQGNRGMYYQHSGVQLVTRKEKITTGMSETSSKSVEDTLSVKIMANGSFQYGGITSGIGAEVTRTLKIMQPHSTTRMTERSIEVVKEFPAEKQMAFVLYSLVDRYTLTRMDDSLCLQWEIVAPSENYASLWGRVGWDQFNAFISVGNGNVLARRGGDLVLYRVSNDGTLDVGVHKPYNFVGRGGWDQFDAFIPVGNGNVLARRGGDLVLYRDTDRDGVFDVGGPNNVVGRGGWDQFDAFIPVGNGNVLARRGGDLVLYRDTDGNGILDVGDANNVVGRGGWDQFDAFIPVAGGIVLARRGGDLVLYRDTVGDGVFDVGGPNNVVGGGWDQYDAFIAVNGNVLARQGDQLVLHRDIVATIPESQISPDKSGAAEEQSPDESGAAEQSPARDESRME